MTAVNLGLQRCLLVRDGARGFSKLGGGAMERYSRNLPVTRAIWGWRHSRRAGLADHHPRCGILSHDLSCKIHKRVMWMSERLGRKNVQIEPPDLTARAAADLLLKRSVVWSC